MEGWKTYTLEEICLNITDGAHASPKEDITGEKMIATVKDMTAYGFKLNQCKKISNQDFKKLVSSGCIPDNGDVLFSKDGTIGKVLNYKSDFKIGVLSSIAIFKPNKILIDSTFLALYLKEKNINKFIVDNFKSGSAIPRIILRDFKKFELTIPPLQEQKAIASILSALDDKIELNLQMNKTLEEMAMALYKHWFVDFGPFQDGKFVESEIGMIPEGWEVKSIGDLYKTTSGGTPSRSKIEYYDNGQIPWVKSKELYGTFVIDSEEKISQLGLNKSSAKIIPAKSVLLAMYGATVGESSILSIEATCNQAICAIIEKSISYLYIFHYLRYFKVDVLNQATGSAQQNISQEIIKNLRIIEPTNTLTVFSELESYYNVIQQNLVENQTLTTLRDTLLPKLISGEVRVKDIEHMVAASL